ncbi:TIGR03016 family PEP-CTERM system-associated outer membrane protein [Colwellia hornerae]|uniref:TIGR03016 family PEP-CTERM system-associated outer membrane protein n=1 Tax=Colwellia hornerae TaxID=89402 RepID=A0A5C6QAC9_9GAMM|nr:TIGR03016 family PEP-CTERM system-associated outer membrane protein [Colwellia hornerae]TWX51073.1 TIGR03016 family PEP-CTERM system-associated outer membrane protein [Colwellia hornerae]TWX56751.1 TIGR03016 family PEP-CTERM system-associated outer membrane protein [Colwellia hornerae]TWX65721.1 TIGR03016 family PEP-CTERM system-associated outer membrane protein [Colwellia hornerae]
MAIMVMDTAQNKKKFAVAIFAILSANTFAGEWQFTPQLIIDETYTDNVNLAVSDQTSSLVTQAGLDFSTLFSSKKLEFSLNSSSVYAMYSHDHDTDDDFHTLDSNFRLKLGPNGLALIGSASISNQSRNSSNNALADIVSGDTTRVENYTAGFEYTINNSDFSINSIIQYRTTKSQDAIGERQGYGANLLSKNGSAARHIYWDASSEFADYTNQGRVGTLFKGELKIGLITNYKITPFLRYYDETNEGDLTRNNSSSLESDSYGGGLRWLISPKLLLDVSYNTPTGTQLDLDGKQQQDYTAASIHWVPSQRTSLKVDYGQRFYGESYGLDFTHKNKRLTNSITYGEEVRAFTRNNYQSVALGSYYCPQSEIIDTSACFLSNNDNINIDDYQLVNLNDFVLVEDLGLSLNKELKWSSALTLTRTIFNILVSSSSREDLNTRLKSKNQSASFAIKRKVSGKSNLQLKLEYNDNHFLLAQENERQDRYRRYSLEYDKSLNSRLNIKLGLSHLNRSSTAQSFNYQEDRVYLKFSKGF